MAGGLKLSVLGVAVFATERRLDLAMAHQAIRHPGHVGWADLIRFLQAAMAGFAGVVRVQVGADAAGRLEIRLVVDGLCQERRHVAHLQVQSMAELDDADRLRWRNHRIVVAIEAHLTRGQQVVLDTGTAGRRGMAGEALQFECQVDTMRKRRSPTGGAGPQQQKKDSSQALIYPCS